MQLIQASLLSVVLLHAYLFVLAISRPTTLPEPQPVCNADMLNAYFLEMYKLYSMQAELKAVHCDKEFNKQPINPAFCECDSITGKQAEPQVGAERGFEDVTEETASGHSPDRQDGNSITPQSCGFTIILDLTHYSNDEPIAADVAMYKLPPSHTLTRNTYYTVNLTVIENSLSVITTTKTIDTETSEGWQVFRANELKSILTAAPHEFYIKVEVEEEDGSLLSCHDIQTLFILDCTILMPPSDGVPSDQNLLPILVFFTQSEVPWWEKYFGWGRRRRDITESTSKQPRKEHQSSVTCRRAPQIMSTQDLLGEDYQVISPKTVDVGICVEDSMKLANSKTWCTPAEMQNVHTLARNKRTNKLVQKTFPVVSTCA